MKRFLRVFAVFLLSLLITPASAQIGGGLFGNRTPAQVIEVGKSGAKFSVICGATCTSATSTCVAGSAIASITDSSITKPYIVHVNPGVYNECVSIDEKTDISLIGSGWIDTIIRPTVTSSADVNGGVCRIAPDANASNGLRETARIELAFLTCQDDAFNSPESAIQIGEETGNGPNVGAGWTDVYLHDYRSIGAHDSTQIFGSLLGTDTNLPRSIIRDAILIGGADTLVYKGFNSATVQNINATSWSNYCETSDSTITASQTAVVDATGATTTKFTRAAGASGTTDIMVGRRVTLTDTDGGGAGVCGATNNAVGQYWITDDTALLVTFAPAATEAPTAGCTYVIAAVGMPSASPCTDVDWTTIRASHSTFGYWKHTAYHHGTGGTIATSPGDDIIRVSNSKFTVFSNDFGPGPAVVTCVGSVQPVVAGILGGYTATDRAADQRFENVDVEVNINADMASFPCTPDIFGVGLVGDLVAQNPIRFSGHVVVNNSGDDDAQIAGIAAGTTTVVPLRIPNAVVSVVNTGGGTSTSAHLWQASSDTLTVGNIVSPEVITTTGTIAGWSEKCFILPPTPIAGWAAGSDNIDIPIMDANVGVQMAYVGCRCIGTCGAANGTFDFEDEAGNAIVAGVVCGEPNAVITWTDMRADADALIPAGSSPRFDTNATPTTTTDQIQFCYRYSTSRFAP